MLHRSYHLVILMGLLVFLLAACNGLQQELPDATSPVPQPVDATPRLSEIAPIPTSTERVATMPTATDQVATITAVTDQMVTIYLVALEDAGMSGKKIGCDDSLVSVEVSTNSSLAAPWNAVAALLSLRETYFGESGLYNALYQSNLDLKSFEINDGNAKVYLEGEMMLGGVCDNPRVEEQIMTTILESGQVNEAEVFINGTLLQDYLSMK